MFKKSYFKLGLAFLLLIATMLTFGVLAGAEEEDNYYLTVHFDEGCKSVSLSYNDLPWQPLSSGTQYKIPKGAAPVSLKVEFERGYTLDTATGHQGAYFTTDNEHRYGSGFIFDDEVTITSKPKTYTIQYLTNPQYATHQFGEFQPTSHTFGATDTKISNPTLTGHKFAGWIMLPTEDADPTTVTDRLTPNKNESFMMFPQSRTPDGDVIYLMPDWEAIQYPVQRVDVVTSTEQGLAYERLPGALGDTWTAKVGEKIYGSQGQAHIYPGYYYNEAVTNANELGTATVKPYAEGSGSYNYVYRFYSPYVYELSYHCSLTEGVTFPTGTVKPNTHTFNSETRVPSPELTGYNFVDWRVEVYDGQAWVEVTEGLHKDSTTGELLLPADTAALASEETDGKRTIRLTACWEPKRFEISYDWADADEALVTFPTEEYDEYTYNADLVIPAPTRRGYTFLGWYLTSGTTVNAEINAVDGSTTLAASTYTDAITLTARWQANTYRVTLGGNGAADWTDPVIEVVYDTAFALPIDFVLPTRVGHDFIGFSLDAEGTEMYTDETGAPLTALWQIDADTTLYAQWTRHSYTVSVKGTDGALLPHGTVTINGVAFDGTPHAILFGETVTVRVDCTAGYKVIRWQGMGATSLEAVEHDASFEYTFVLGAENVELIGLIAPVIGVPTLKVDYVTETLMSADGALPDGKYLVTDGTVSLEVEIVDGKITVKENGTSKQVSAVRVPESAFGKTLYVTVFGDGTTTANSDAIELVLAARPAAPEMNNGNREIASVYQNGDTAIIIQMKLPVDLSRYEFAFAENDEGLNLTWFAGDELTSPAEGAVMFENLRPGTNYYFYVRARAKANEAPHGDAHCIPQHTKSVETLEAVKTELLNLIQPTDGEMVRKLIQDAVDEANRLASPSPTFYDSLQAIKARVQGMIDFARVQDARIAELTALRDKLVGSGAFTTESVNYINTVYSIAVEAIKNATGVDTVYAAFETAEDQMLAVLITYLFNDPLELTADAGLPQGIKLLQSRLENLSGLIAAVNDAIASGRVSMGGSSMTLAEVNEALQSLEVVAAYSMKLTDGSSAFTSFRGNYELRLLIPNDLRGETGLLVGYYDEKTGLQVLDTTRDGNYLIFTSDRIADFVILADPTVNLTGLIYTLFGILFCQLIAVILLLVNRAKNAKRAGTKHYGFALLPVALTVRVIPANAMMMVWILAGLVLVFQILLIYLLLSSNVFKRRRGYRDETNAAPVMAPVDEPETYSEPEGQNVTTDEAAAIAVFEASEDGEIEPDEEEEPDEPTVDESEAVEEDPYAEYEDFIEPAPTPRYSLEDEEIAETLTEDEEPYGVYGEEDVLAEEEPYDLYEEELPTEELEEQPVYEGEEPDDVAAYATYDEEPLEVDEPVEDAEEAPVEEPSAEEPVTEETREEPEEEPIEEDLIYLEPDATGDDAPKPAGYGESDHI